MYSIIVPVRDRTRELVRCLVGALWQDFGDYEVIVVDYGASPPIRVPKGVRLIRCETDEWNLSIALNIGIANSLGDRLVILNADDIMAPDLLSTVDSRLNKNDRQMWYWQRFNLSAEGRVKFDGMSDEEVKGLMSSGVAPEELGFWGCIHCYGDFLAVEKAPIVELGGYDERMFGWGYMDSDMDLRMRALGYEHRMGIGDFKLVHQHHSIGRMGGGAKNRALMDESIAAGQLVRNGGPEHFGRYKL